MSSTLALRLANLDSVPCTHMGSLAPAEMISELRAWSKARATLGGKTTAQMYLL